MLRTDTLVFEILLEAFIRKGRVGRTGRCGRQQGLGPWRRIGLVLVTAVAVNFGDARDFGNEASSTTSVVDGFRQSSR